MDTQTYISKIQNGDFAGRFADIYGEDQIVGQTGRYIEALRKYESYFAEGDVEVYSAPGRTEIGGNHTDHQNGMVLAASINLDAIGVVRKLEEARVVVISEGYDPIAISLEDDQILPEEAGTTKALIKGVLAGVKERGYKIGGFQAYITSDVLNGAGLSSSAAFETLVGTILSGLYNEMKISPIEIAVIGQYAENVYFGKPCGLMDQMASSVGSLVHIDFRIPEEPRVEKIDYDMSMSGYSLCIVDTKGSHADLTPDYAAIPSEMKAVAAYFKKDVLTQVREEDFYEKIPEIRERVGDRAVLRAIHFYEENKRVEQEADALREKDFEKFLHIFRKSADSSYKYLQNVYSNQQVQNQAMPITLALSEQILGEDGAARVHGGGFAGTIQVFVKSEAADAYRQKIEEYMGKGTCHLLKIRRYGGMKVF